MTNVSLLRDMISSREGAGDDFINFLKYMADFEQGLAGAVAGDITLEQATAVNVLLLRTVKCCKSLKDIAPTVIFSNDLHNRMSLR